jgi:phosphatidylglycerophosphate synthase
VTLAGFGCGLLAAALIAFGAPLWSLPFIALSRLCDGLDGAVARATQKTDIGGFIDIVADFAFYGAIPLAFAVWMPAENALPAAFLVTTFYINGATFLGYAVLAERHGQKTVARGSKSLYFTGGLLEGTETILLFTVICLWPGLFPVAAWLFGAATLVTASSRILLAFQVFRKSAGHT